MKIAGHPIRDFFALDPRGVATYSYYDPDRFYRDPTTFTPEQIAAQRANMATMRLLAGQEMYDPKLLNRLGRVKTPALVIWGDSDRIVTPEYGHAFANAFANAQFIVVPKAGHLPHFEQPEATFAALDGFLQSPSQRRA